MTEADAEARIASIEQVNVLELVPKERIRTRKERFSHAAGLRSGETVPK